MTEPVVDRGLQAERTTLAWWRTAIAAGVACALIVRQAADGPEVWTAVAVTAMALGVVLTVVARRSRALRRQRVGTPAPGPTTTLPLVLGLAALQVLAVVLVL